VVQRKWGAVKEILRVLGYPDDVSLFCANICNKEKQSFITRW